MAWTAVTWTENMDAALIDLRVTRKVAWKAVAVRAAEGEAVSLSECKKRLKFLQANGGAPVAAPAAAKKHEPNDRDGLLWLAGKKRLKHTQVVEGLYYRDLFRKAAPRGGGIKSSLDFGAGVSGSGGGGVMFGSSVAYDAAQVQLELFVIRQIVLHGQVDMLTVMDGVCGLGHSVRFLAGGDQIRAAQLEAILRVALDQMAANRKVKDSVQPARAAAA